MNWTNVNVHMSVPRFSPRFILLTKKERKIVCVMKYEMLLWVFFFPFSLPETS